MKEYTVRYLHWSGVRIKKDIKLPESFQDLTRKQLLYYFKLTVDGANKEELVHRFFRKFYAKLPVERILRYREVAEKAKKIYTWRMNQEAFENNAYYLDKLTKLFSFFDQIRDFKIAPKRWLLWYRGPADELKNISIYEFALLENEILKYLYSGEQEAMDRFCAIMYRPVSIRRLFSRKDKRQELDETTIPIRAERLDRVPDYYKVAILTWFKMIRKDLPKRYPDLFNNHSNDDSDPDKFSWGDVIMTLSGDIPGTEEQVAKTNAWNFMYRMDLLIREQEEFKQKNDMQ